MSVNGLNSNEKFIDSRSANVVSESLMSSLKNKTVDYSKVNLQGFSRPTLGVDFYSSKTDLALQRQISMTNAGVLDSNINLTSVQALNSFAAQQLYASNVQDAVGGKMTIDTAGIDVKSTSSVQDIQNVISVFETDRDKKGSNPFTFENSLESETENSEKKD